MRRFAEHVCLRDVRLRTLQSYYRQIRLLSEWLGGDPARASQRRARAYILHLKEERGWSASSRRQAVAAMRMFYCGMLGKKWKLWDIVQVRDRRRLPMVLEIGQVAAVLKAVALGRHLVPLHLIYCCGLRLEECVRLTVDDIVPRSAATT